MLPRNVQHYYVTNADKTEMYGYDEHGELRMIFALPWLRPYLFCSAIAAQKIAKEYRALMLIWPGRIYENSPSDNALLR